MRLPLIALSTAALSMLGLQAAELPREKHAVGDRQVTVSNRKEIPIKARSDADVKVRHLWYGSYDGNKWGPWQKHGLTFSRETPITWSPTEGHWRIYVQITEVSGNSMPDPTPNQKSPEFIIDRTLPTGSISFPPNGEKLKSNAKYTITWEAKDEHLHSRGITLKWSRGNDSDAVAIEGATNIANTGSFEWTTPSDMTKDGRIILEMTDKAGNVGSSENTGIILDAIAPSRNILGPAITANRQTDVSIKTSDAGPSGLAKAQLFYSHDNGSTWSPGPAISKEPFTAINWTAPNDGLFILALVATDQAGNSNDRPATKEDAQFEILVDTERPAISLKSPIGIADKNHKPNAPVRRVFKPGDAVEVNFTIKELNPRADGVTVFLQTEEGGRWEPIGQSLPHDKTFAYSIPDLSTASARIKVQAIDVAGNTSETIASEAFRIDNKVEAGTVEIDL